MGKTLINLQVPIKFKKELEEAAKKSYMSRSNYIRIAVIEKINREKESIVDLQ